MDNSDDEYYSEDFEHDEMDEVVEVIQEIKVPQKRTPRPPPQPKNMHDSASEDAILVFKSATGPRLTIQPRKVKKAQTLMNHTRTISESSLDLRTSAMKRTYMNKSTGGRQRVLSANKHRHRNTLVFPTKSEEEEEGLHSREPSQEALNSPTVQCQTRQLVQTSKSHSHSSCRMGTRGGNYRQRLTTTTICTGPMAGGNRKVPGSTNITNRNYTREKRYITTAYNNPPMRIGPAKQVGAGTVAQRVASAKRISMNDLKNKINMLVKEIEDLKKDNKCLKVLQNRQNMALKKWEGRDAELPKLLQQHKDETKVMQTQMKKTIAHCRELEEKGRAKDKKIARLEIELQNLKTLTAREDLRERSVLTEQVEMLSANVAGCEKRIRQYMRHIEIMESNHKHQIIGEKQKLIKANNHALELRHEITGLKISLKDKDRLVNYISMRSTGRSLMKSYNEKDSKSTPTLRQNPLSTSFRRDGDMKSSPDINVTTSSRSFSDKYEPHVEVLEELQKFSNQFRAEGEEEEEEHHENLPAEKVEKSAVGESEAKPETIVETRDEKRNSQEAGVVINQETATTSSDGVNNNDKNNQLITALESTLLPTTTVHKSTSKNEYSKISKLLGVRGTNSNPKKPLKLIKKSASTGPLVAQQVVKKVSSPFPVTKSSKSRVPLLTSQSDGKPSNSERPQEMQLISTGPKTHSDAKREMKLQSSELYNNSNKSPQQRKQWGVWGPVSNAQKNSTSSQGVSCREIETTVKVRSPIEKTQIPWGYAGRKSSSQTQTYYSPKEVESIAVPVRKYQRQFQEEDPSCSSDDSCSPNVSDLEFDTARLTGGTPPLPLESLVVPPPPPQQFSKEKLAIPASNRSLQEGEIRKNEAVMANFLLENSQKLSCADIPAISFSTIDIPRNLPPSRALNNKYASVSNIPSHEAPQYRSLLSRTPQYSSSTSVSQLYSNFPAPNTTQDLLNSMNSYDSPRSDIGPNYGQMFHHQNPQYPQTLSASARPAAALQRPNVPQQLSSSSQRYQEVPVQGAFSFPQVPQTHSPISRPDSRRVFNYSDNVSQVHNNQPMNLPFFSAAGDGSQQMGDHTSPKLNQLPNKKQDTSKKYRKPKQLSHYDPSFFTKLGNWK